MPYIQQLIEDIFSVGILNPGLRVFDIIMSTEFGTSYNAYLIRGSEKTALVETTHNDYTDIYLENIRKIVPLEEIDYVVMNHNEPDHSGALAKLIEHSPKLEVLTSQAGAIYLKNITNIPDLNVRAVKDGECVSLGNKTLQFITAPFLHWPDSMFTWVEEEKALFTCDFFGAHYCEPQMVDRYMLHHEDYEKSFKEYYDAIFGPFPKYVLKGLEKTEELDPEYVMTSHGPVLTPGCRYEYARDCYKKWATPKEVGLRIPIFYTSAYGHTQKLAVEIKKGIESVLPQAVVPIYDIIEHEMGALTEELNNSTAFLLGSPTINKNAVPPSWNLLSHVDCINNQKKPVACFGSFGWSGEAVGLLNGFLSNLKFHVVDDGFKVQFLPSESQLKEAFSYGEDFAKKLSV